MGKNAAVRRANTRARRQERGEQKTRSHRDLEGWTDASRQAAEASVTPRDADHKTLRCAACGHEAAAPRGPTGFGTPVGWYAVSVGAVTSRNGKGYYYLGVLCSVRCLRTQTRVWEEHERRAAG
jgi:hypothetical protein